jgi:hypothetical protein
MEEALGSDGKALPQSMDGRFWAEEFVKLHGGDAALMHTWFANAIMAGYDEAQRRHEPDAQRYRFLADHYGRSKDLHMDGRSRWYVNTPYLSRKPTVTLDQAIDADMAEQEADTRQPHD